MDNVFRAFLMRQFEEGMGLAESSDLLHLIPLDGPPPQHYMAHFGCRGLVKSPSGDIVEAEGFGVGITFASDYLRCARPFEAVSWLGPNNVWHPNIGRGPFRKSGPLFICLGQLKVGTPLVDILYQCWEIITFAKRTLREDDALNWDACAWARRTTHRFPVDDRPLRRRSIDFEVEPVSTPGKEG